jgi:hypothetical protein
MAAERVYIGIDPTAGKRLLTYTVLDADLNVLDIGDANFEGVLEAVGAYPVALCAVDAPSGPGMGLMADPDYRTSVGLKANTARYTSFRVSEFELRRRNIGLYRTPRGDKSAPAWMQLGWRLYESLRGAGYVRHPQSGPRQVIEVHPHACFTVLLDGRPYRKTTLEGRIQRQLVLYEEGLNVADPMDVFEEWTRHKVLTSQIRLDDLYEHDRLDALVAAYTAYLLAEQPERTTRVGDPREGTIVVPAGALRERY